MKSEILSNYPDKHEIRSDRALYDFVMDIKKRYLKNSPAPDRVLFDHDPRSLQRALGLQTTQYRPHGGNIRVRHEIRISSLFKDLPMDFLRMVVVHELAHLKIKQHNKVFYQLCLSMEPSYFEIERDLAKLLSITFKQTTGD